MKPKVLVVVLGDLARSPRMQYHCMSLAKNDYDVTVIANGNRSSGDKGFEELESNKNIKQRLMSDNIEFKTFLPSILAYLIRPIWQSMLMILQLVKVPKPHVIILQNPPSIPTLPVIYLYARLVRSRLIIDWHNFGHSILALNLKTKTHPLVRIYSRLELFFGRLADAGFCVSKAMQAVLRDEVQVTYPLHVLYDRPPNHFKPLSVHDKHEFFLRIKETIPQFGQPHTSGESSDLTRFTCIDESGEAVSRPDRPAIILSSTSWTEDEDFDLLLDALKLYDQLANSSTRGSSKPDKRLPGLVCVITGKGPLKAHFEDKIAECKFEHIEFVLPWLSAEDYTKMIGSCDLGISLHCSSSGVDLPMKVVDLLGCGIPVLAYRYSAINELVKPTYGYTFENSTDLFSHLKLLLDGFCHSRARSRLDRFRECITRGFVGSRWDSNWNDIAKPIFDQLRGST